MIKIIKNATVYAPDLLGKKDILIIGDKIAAIENTINFYEFPKVETEIIEGEGKIITPGFIDSHVHMIGGGGEGGFKTRTPEIMLSDITTAGVTTLVGCLGTDGVTRSMEALLAKSRALEEEGVTTYIYSGSYRVPLTTLTGDIMKDIMLIDKVIGIGEIAISDHRSSNPSQEDLLKVASNARVGGILAAKAGLLNIHIGDSKNAINQIIEITKNTEIPYNQFLPTHINRNPYLLEAGKGYARLGGFIDFTTSTSPIFNDDVNIRASKALKICLIDGVLPDNITFSSDGQGSLPRFNDRKECIGLRVGKISTLFEEVRLAVKEEEIPLEIALRVITSNPAKLLKLNTKGAIKVGLDADLVILEERNLEIESVIAKGRVMVRNKLAEIRGTFEN